MRWQIEAMPAWPYPTTRAGKSNPFRVKWAETLDLLTRELEHLNVTGAVAMRVVATEADVRLDGMLRAKAKVGYRGVILSFQSKHGPLSYPCDTFQGSYYGDMVDWQINVRAIALALEALRKVDRYGVTKHGEQYSGWRAIESSSPSGFTSVDEAIRWLRSFTGITNPEVSSGPLLRRAAVTAHPDAGGDPADWDRVDAARQLIERAKGGA